MERRFTSNIGQYSLEISCISISIDVPDERIMLNH
jgi:hypothetical protein